MVAKGFQEETQQNVYAPVARIQTVRLLVSIAVQENLPIRQLDVPTAFLNGNLNTEIYMYYPDGLKPQKGEVLCLRKALYGLNEAPRCWNEELHNFMIKNRFEQSKHDFCLYIGEESWVLIFVDDILVIGKGDYIIN